MTKTLAACFAFLLVLALSRPTLADIRQSCQDDIQRLCSFSQSGFVSRCLRQNESQLSPPCQTAFQTHIRGMKACRADGKQLCGNVKGRALFECLEQHQSYLSSDCAGLLASRHQKPQPPTANPSAQ